MLQRVISPSPTTELLPDASRLPSRLMTKLCPSDGFAFDLATLKIPRGTTLAVFVNPNNPNGGTLDMSPLPDLARRNPDTSFLVDEAFIGLAGESVAHLVPKYPNLIVTRTLSKAHSLAGFRVQHEDKIKKRSDELRT